MFVKGINFDFINMMSDQIGKYGITLDHNVKERYESLHEDLLYIDEKQELNEAIETFDLIDHKLQSIGE